MKLRILSVLAALAMVAAFSLSANAQYMTQDVIFLKGGYIPTYNVTFNEKTYPASGAYKPNDLEGSGFCAQGEYNLNFNGFWMGFGMEYQYIKIKGSTNNKDLFNNETKHSFILPMVSFKVAAVGGLYVGAGVAGKYLIATESDNSGSKASKKIDLWANGILGYHVPIGEGVFLDLEGRFGWNLTNKQFSEFKDSTTTNKTDPKNAYDIAFYVGVGFRAIGSNY
jgi:hypothetical protein